MPPGAGAEEAAVLCLAWPPPPPQWEAGGVSGAPSVVVPEARDWASLGWADQVLTLRLAVGAVRLLEWVELKVVSGVRLLRRALRVRVGR